MSRSVTYANAGAADVRRGGGAMMRAFRVAFFASLPLLAGCPVTADLPQKAEIQQGRVRDTRSPYYFYIPSRYSDARPVPLVILCHGTKPYDTAWAQIREWAAFAEEHDIIVAAPELVGVKGDFPPPAAKQIQRQMEDEKTILSLVETLKASHRIAPDGVFICGWSAGAYAVLHTGLRNPDVFRALAVRQGNFDADFMDYIPARLDRWQPVFIYYGSMDPVAAQTRAAIKWLRDQGMYVEEQEQPGVHRRVNVSVAWRFFSDVMRNRPWIRLRSNAAPELGGLAVQFAIDTTPRALDVRWDFGDSTTGEGERPSHRYETRGEYEVSAVVRMPGGKSFKRVKRVTVPVLAELEAADESRPPP